MLEPLEKALYREILEKEARFVTKRLFYFFIAYGFIFVITFVFLIRTLNLLSKFYRSSLEIYGWVQSRYA